MSTEQALKEAEMDILTYLIEIIKEIIQRTCEGANFTLQWSMCQDSLHLVRWLRGNMSDDALQQLLTRFQMQLAQLIDEEPSTDSEDQCFSELQAEDLPQLSNEILQAYRIYLKTVLNSTIDLPLENPNEHCFIACLLRSFRSYAKHIYDSRIFQLNVTLLERELPIQ